MITRIELDGFKTFDDFKLELAPFQIIVGANGAGKSNLFDALRLLSRLVDDDLRSAFGALRGEAGELFTLTTNGQARDTMRLAVELLVDRRVEDSWGATAEITYTRLRYELHIARRRDELGLERLYVTHEALKPIPRGNDDWAKRILGEQRVLWLQPLKAGRSTDFISTSNEGGHVTIALHQDGHGGRKLSNAQRMERTVLSSVTNTEFPHAFAAREELRRWSFLHLNPEVLREPSPRLAQPNIAPDGSHLPNTLARMQQQDAYLLNDVARDLANLVPGIVTIGVDDDAVRQRYTVWARTQDGRRFSSRVLSDGTLRLLALVTLQHDPDHSGVICFEEPENGLHPSRLQNLARLLQDLATNFAEPEQADEPLRQMLVNTHSPVLISQPGLVSHVLYASMATRLAPGQDEPALRVTRIVPVEVSPQLKLDLGLDDPDVKYTIAQVVQYLHNADNDEAIAEVQRKAMG